MEFRFRSDSVSLTIESLIKAIEARTMDTASPSIRSGQRRPRGDARYEHERQVYQQKVTLSA